MRLRRLRVYWLPFLLLALDIGLLLLSCLVALLLAPIVLVVLAVLAALRWLASLLTGGRWPAKRRHVVEHAAPQPANPGSLTTEVREQLAHMYRPAIVAFPEDEDLGPPYRRDEFAGFGGADYHPRAVNLLLDHARLRQGRFQWLPEMPDVTKQSDVRAFLGDKSEAASSLEIPWLHGGNPLKIVRHLFPFGRQFRAHWSVPVPKSDCGCSIEAWRRYSSILRTDAERGSEARYGHTLYARIVEGRELPEIGPQSPLSGAIAVQYWWFIFYNDAWNRHQGDWEGITVFLVPDGGTLSPIGSAFSSHDQGRWRRWEDVHRLDDNGVEDPGGLHPVVYMARGSHASYFDYNSTGYHPSMSRKFRLPFLGDFEVPSHMVLQSRTAVDWVADTRGLKGATTIATDDVRLMPPQQVLTDLPKLRQDDDWWWLAYEGLWGAPEPLPFFGGSGPRGPRLQGVKWDNPFTWVMRECMADDLPYWVKTFARWQLAEATRDTQEAEPVKT